jgi:hypothetical protein
MVVLTWSGFFWGCRLAERLTIVNVTGLLAERRPAAVAVTTSV